MSAKHRVTVIFAMLSLTVLMLFFQNCSSSEGLFTGDSVTDGFITNPPVVFAAKDSSCSTPNQTFKMGDTVFVCIRNAGAAPIYCHSHSGAGCGSYVTVSSYGGWVGNSGNWFKSFPISTVANNTSFIVGYSYTVYAMHTEDPSATGQYSFTVTP